MTSSGFNTSFGANHQYAQLNNSLGTDRKNQPQYKKIFCAYHSTQFLTNFCIDKQCLMPLCPTCVVQHTEQHYQNNQRPAYVNLNDAMHDSKQRCYSNIVKLEQFNRKNIEMSNYIQGLPDYIRKQLAQCKQKLYHFIDDKFEAFQGKLIDSIRAKYDEQGVYNRKQCEEVREYISNEIQNLYDRITQLKGDQCLSALIRYYESDQKKLEEEMLEIVDYIEKNKAAGGLYISINEEEMAQGFSKICERLVNVQYITQDQSKSFNSTKNIQFQGSNRKGLSGSMANKGNPNVKTATKQKQMPKTLISSQTFSSQKQQEKNYYPSPLKTSPHF